MSACCAYKPNAKPHMCPPRKALLTRSLQGLPADLRARINELRAKREDGSINDAVNTAAHKPIIQPIRLHSTTFSLTAWAGHLPQNNWTGVCNAPVTLHWHLLDNARIRFTPD